MLMPLERKLQNESHFTCYSSCQKEGVGRGGVRALRVAKWSGWERDGDRGLGVGVGVETMI